MPGKPQKEQSVPPEISPYLFPAILAAMGAWCLYDGWLTANPAMHEHLLFNRVASGILLPWAIIDYIRTRRLEARERGAEYPGDAQGGNDK